MGKGTNFYSLVGVILYLLISCFLIWTWYAPVQWTDFHFFNDGLEWWGMDKLGHIFTCYQVGRFALLLQYNDIKISKSTLKAQAFLGFILMFPFEILDGFGPQYGFSFFDLMANALGAVLVWVQWTYFPLSTSRGEIQKEEMSSSQTFSQTFKFSWWPSAWAELRPDLLGHVFPQQIIKDYNAQAFWWRFSLNKTFRTQVFPPWLGFAIGFGAEGLLGGHDNVWTNALGLKQDFSHIAREPQIFLSLDIDLETIHSWSPAWKKWISLANMVKVPFPNLDLIFYFRILIDFLINIFS